MKDKEFQTVWTRPVVKIGMTTMLLAAALSFLPVIYLAVVYDTFQPLDIALKAWGMIAALFGAFYIVEPISYYSILGLAGTYLSFLSGNISNLRLPCAAMALDVTNTESGTHEAEVVSTLGITGSIITNLIGVTLAAFVGAALIQVLPPVITDAFKNYTVPAIFGAVFGQFAIKFPKLAVVAFIIPVTLRLTTSFPAWVFIIASVFGTIIIARLMYNNDKKKSSK
jgi:hypothetical protein